MHGVFVVVAGNWQGAAMACPIEALLEFQPRPPRQLLKADADELVTGGTLWAISLHP